MFGCGDDFVSERCSDEECLAQSLREPAQDAPGFGGLFALRIAQTHHPVIGGNPRVAGKTARIFLLEERDVRLVLRSLLATRGFPPITGWCVCAMRRAK